MRRDPRATSSTGSKRTPVYRHRPPLVPTQTSPELPAATAVTKFWGRPSAVVKLAKRPATYRLSPASEPIHTVPSAATDRLPSVL